MSRPGRRYALRAPPRKTLTPGTAQEEGTHSEHRPGGRHSLRAPSTSTDPGRDKGLRSQGEGVFRRSDPYYRVCPRHVRGSLTSLRREIILFPSREYNSSSGLRPCYHLHRLVVVEKALRTTTLPSHMWARYKESDSCCFRTCDVYVVSH